jgi:DNA-binding XRE family transcriptional regulator
MAKIPRKPAGETWRSAPRGNPALGRVARKLGKRIRALRKEQGFSQESLAELADIAARHMREIEHGRMNITIATALAIAKALDVSLSELFEGV